MLHTLKDLAFSWQTGIKHQTKIHLSVYYLQNRWIRREDTGFLTDVENHITFDF